MTEKTGVLSQEGLQRDPEAYNLAMQARDRLDDELSKAASAASTAEETDRRPRPESSKSTGS